MKPIIKVENLSKQYTIGGASERYSTFRESVVKTVKAPFNALRNGRRNGNEQFWALKDINFEVTPGEVVGIIGRNGAGKSTLLKILSRITEPTTGKVDLYGRVGSLLEVGTGFHPELTGRENIYLNGAILGMKHDEISKKFDEIVDFAEIEEFLDTPVKRYSSGMYMRLAFGVAAHLEPEVLMVDEVLAVGDAQFQKKCLKKMKDVGEHGRTVLFVSHDMQAMSRLCGRVIWLSSGNVMEDGATETVIGSYLLEQATRGAERTWDADTGPGNETARLRSVRVRNRSGETVSTVNITDPVAIEMTYDVLKDGVVMAPNIHLFNDRGVCLFVTVDIEKEWKNTPRPFGSYTSTVWIPGNFLSEGSVIVRAALTTFRPMIVHFDEPDAVMFHVVESSEGETARGDYTGVMPGVVRPILKWETKAEMSAT